MRTHKRKFYLHSPCLGWKTQTKFKEMQLKSEQNVFYT